MGTCNLFFFVIADLKNFSSCYVFQKIKKIPRLILKNRGLVLNFEMVSFVLVRTQEALLGFLVQMFTK